MHHDVQLNLGTEQQIAFHPPRGQVIKPKEHESPL
jgi:hypothetical protein